MSNVILSHTLADFEVPYVVRWYTFTTDDLFLYDTKKYNVQEGWNVTKSAHQFQR